MLKEAKAGKGFRDLTTCGTYLEHLLTPEAKIRLLGQELAYEEGRQHRERQDREDFRRIVEAYQFRGYAKGARGIYMRLIHQK